MKLLILGANNSRNSGGIFNNVISLSQNLYHLSSIDLHLLMHDDEYSCEDRKQYHPIPLHTYNLNWPKKLGYSRDMYFKIQIIEPDIIHTQGIWLYLSYVNKKYNYIKNTPYIISPHGMLDIWQLKQSFWKDTKKKIALFLYENRHLKNANCIHALCQNEYKSIRNFGLNNPIAVIPNGTEIPKLLYRDENFITPCRWEKSENRKTLLFLSRIHHKKGLNNLLNAWSLIHPLKQNWQLVIAGETKDEKYLDSLLKLAIKLKINDTIQFIGGQYGDNKAACFIDADAFILPSFSEGLPLVILEAWSYKLPVIMTSFCNIPDGFIKNAAIQIEPNPESIANGIQTLISFNDQQRLNMGKNGYDLVLDKYTWNKIADSFKNLYEWILGKKDMPNFVYNS